MPRKAQEPGDQIDRNALPAHIAIIMDGNGRWAHKRGLPRVAGHRAGINAVREVIEGSAELGIPVLTLYAFSVENWKRPQAEVSTLMQLLKQYLKGNWKTSTKTISGSARSGERTSLIPRCNVSWQRPSPEPAAIRE